MGSGGRLLTTSGQRAESMLLTRNNNEAEPHRRTPLQPDGAAYARLLLPFVLSTLTQPLLGAVDTAVMGRLPDPSYIAGVSVGAVIFSTIYWLLGFLRVGSTGFSAQAAAEPADQAPHALARALWQPMFMALGLGLLILCVHAPIFQAAMLLLELDAPSRAVAHTYYTILVWCAPLVLMNYVMLGWLMGLSRIRATLFMQIGGNLLNMALDILFVLHWGWGVEGVAVASCLAHVFSFAAGCLAVRRILPPAYAAHAHLGQKIASLLGLLRLEDMRRMLAVNGHLFLRTVCLLAQTNAFMATASRFGTLTLAADAIIIQMMLIFSYAFEGIANASSVFAGSAAGSGNRGILKACLWQTLVWTLGSALIMGLIYGLWREPLLGLFTELPDVRAEALRYAAWGLGFPLLAGIGLSFYGVFTGMSHTRPVFLSTLLALLLFALVWGMAVPRFGNDGLWAAYLAFYLGRSLFLLPFVRRLFHLPCFAHAGHAPRSA